MWGLEGQLCCARGGLLALRTPFPAEDKPDKGTLRPAKSMDSLSAGAMGATEGEWVQMAWPRALSLSFSTHPWMSTWGR